MAYPYSMDYYAASKNLVSKCLNDKAFANNIMLNLKSKYKAEFDTKHMQAVYVHIQKGP